MASTLRRVLVVEDDERILRNIDMMLSHHGFAVTAVSGPGDAEQALRRAAEAEQHFELAVLDYDLGGPVDGLALLKTARGLHPEIRAIMSSGGPMPEVLPPAEAVLNKPYLLEDLVAMAENVLAQP